ncbi:MULTISPECIES: DUF6908 domain-containing protein [Ruminococcus]|uniref:DEAD/DEAH box helicase family protein n=1 Tax=Ruminococcus bicirculans (ex Wegman et al. 2014) TaxID=1160721 RepID=A0AAW6DT60_9FIRM|nr:MULTISPECIES: SNF2-related protein [Ruminococcus]MDB8735242.1 DEAD/DEAH box helicase family protein [Ruminococcus bicirculans (ex Wegman et al. 2014)]MDB8740703.1 DEAD/DEAH box helicase family protein [Ruminococcus bicirculans (ex Wegman et al. 2014)]
MKKFNLQEWLEFHKFASNLYAYPYDEQLQIYNINRNATAVAPFEVWSNIGLRINGGTRSMTIYDKNGIKKHLFDVSQTNGKDIKPWKYNVSYNEYIFDMLDKMYEKNGSETRADRGEKTFHNNIYDYVFESVYSHPKSPTGQLSTELCELIAETVTYTVCERLNVIEEQYKYDFSNFPVINENAQELVGTVAAVYVNVFCRTAKQLVKTVSLEEAQGRQAMRKPIVNDDISEFEQKVTVEETTVTDNADIETENDISEKEDDRYVVEPDDTVEPEPDYNEFVEVPEKAERLTLTAEQQETVLKQIFQADYKKVNKQAVIKFYNINKSAKVLMRYTYAVYKGSHPIELAEMPDVVKWSATSKGVVFADANGAELYCVNWRTACGYVKQLIRDNEYAISNTIEATSEKEEKETEKYRGNIISASTMKQQRLYSKFVELFPDFLTNYKYLKLESNLGFMTLSLDKIGSNSVAMAHYYDQNGDLMVDPEIVFDIDSKNKTLTAISYQQDGMSIYKTYEPDSDEQDNCNSFVDTWFNNISTQAYRPVKAINIHGKEITFANVLSMDKNENEDNTIVISENGVSREYIIEQKRDNIVNVIDKESGEYAVEVDLENRVAVKFISSFSDNQKNQFFDYLKDYDAVYNKESFIQSTAKALLLGAETDDDYVIIKHIEMIDNDPDNVKEVNDISSEKSFAEQVDDVLAGNANRYNDLKVCDTPQILLDVGCEQLPMLYTQKHLKKVVQPKDLEKHTHGLTTEQIKKLPEWLADPVMIYDSLSRQDSLVVVTSEIDIDNDPIIVSVRPSGNGNYNLRRVNSNFITSVYGRENFDRHLELELQADNILYINKQKSQELFSVLRLQFSQGLNALDSNVIIHQSRNIVKGMQQENNAEQLSFFENSTLEDTEVEIPFAVGDEIDYGERHYTISKIDKEKNTVTLLDYNTGWYPISHDEDLSMVIAEFEAVREKEIVESEALATKPNNFVKIDDEGSVNSGSLSENFVITDEQLGVGGPKQKFNRNVTAIQLLKKIEEENRNITKDEQQVLSEYVGWGGIPEAFDKNNSSWSQEYEQLKNLLTEEEYQNAIGSVLNAHYTQPVVINAMYTALSELGFSGGKILEPAAGVGNFIGCAPENIADRSFFTAVEIDSISGRIAKQLYPESEVQVCGYENAKLRAGTFDVAVGNVPFGDYSVVDKKYNHDHAMIHDYFFLKTLEMVRPNGVIAFITSKGTMDKQSSKIRKQIDEKAEFIGAIRLPNTAFKANAGTTVVSDIIFLKKRSFPQTKLSEWVDTGYNEDGQRINQYFINHPEMICGELKIKSGPYGPEMTVDPFSDKSLKDALSECVENLVNNTDVRYTQLSLKPVAAEADDTQKQEEALPAPENIPDGFYVSINDNIYKRNGSVLVEAKRKSGKAFTEREKGMLTLAIDLAKDLRYAVNIQNTDISDEDYEKIRINLESKYNYFSVKYGKITDPNNKLVYNTLRYVRDDNLDFLKSIETPKFEKSDILLKRTIRPSIKITHCDTVEDGFQATLAEYGYIDLNHISKITGYKVDECINRLNGILMYRDPDELFSAEIKSTDGWLTADEYLSGNVVEKLRKAKLLSSRFPELKVNVEALEKVQPEKIKAVDILAQIGSSWIPEKYIEQFVEEVFGIGTVVEHNTATANWKLSNKVNGNYHSSTSTEYGTADINAMYILENSLNLRDSTVWRDKRDELGHLVYDDKGNKVREKDVEKTIAANHKAEKIKETFKEWVWTDAYRTQDLENIYNAKYNTERARTYDGSHLFFAGMTSSIELADHQKNAVARVLYGGNTLLAHVVGAGKTFEMTAAAMEMRRIGAANKPLFIVPNHLIGQWGKEFLTLYPDANILLATSEDFEKSRRKAFVNRIATGDYDAVIMGYSTFAKISISPEKRKEYYQQQIDELIDIIQSSYDDDNLSVKDAQKKKKQLETRLKNLEFDTEQDDNIYFENLGVDALFVDEAHNFKNLSINTKLSRIAGIQTTESKRSEDLLLKIQYIKEKQNGLDRGIVFATGTPISNSLTEMYVMKKYLEPDYLREKGLQHFDSWVADFAEVTTNIELSPTGNSWRAKKRCSTFKNLPELMSIYRRVADIQTAETLKLPVPKLKNGKYTICLTKPSEEQKLFIFDCGERAEEVHQKRVDPSKDNMLKITNDGKMCALDMRLVDPTVEDNPDSKVNMAVNNIFNKWEETKDDSLTQVVFLDRSTPSKGFNLYDDIKSKLIALGIPEEEIKFIHDAKNDKEKVKLFEDVNEGRVRILIGSTEKMGAGTNIQKKLCALHHIDVPWRPSDIEQREGRILRQGNDCKEVEIFRYATEGTFDSYSWQTIEYKQKFISQVMTNKPLGRSIDDVDEAALNYAEIKSLATGDPRIKRQLELSTQVDNLRREKAEFEADRMKAREEITFTIPTQIKRAEKFIEIFDNAVEYSKQYPRSENFCIEIVDNKITDREEAGKAVKALRKVGGEEPIDVCDYRGFKIQIQYSSLGGYGSFKTIVSHENATLFTSLGVSNTDVFDNIDNAIDVDMPQLLSKHKEELEIAQKNMQKSKEIAEREFPKLKEYQEKREELNQLTSEIGLNDNSGDMDIVFKQDAVTSVIDKSYIRDNSGTIIAKFTYSVPESYIEKIYNDDDNLSLEYGSLQEYVKSVQGDNRFYEKSKKARKIVDDDIPAVDDTMFLTFKQCRAIVLEEDSELLTLQGVKSNGEHIKVGTFDYDYQTYQTLSSVGKLYSEKLGIPFGDEDIAASRNRRI